MPPVIRAYHSFGFNAGSSLGRGDGTKGEVGTRYDDRKHCTEPSVPYN